MQRVGNRKYIAQAADFLRVLGDPTRMTILLLLRKRTAGLTVGEIATAVGITHSATSHQLGLLESYGLVTGYREGQAVRYELDRTPYVTTTMRILAAALHASRP